MDRPFGVSNLGWNTDDKQNLTQANPGKVQCLGQLLAGLLGKKALLLKMGLTFGLHSQGKG